MAACRLASSRLQFQKLNFLKVYSNTGCLRACNLSYRCSSTSQSCLLLSTSVADRTRQKRPAPSLCAVQPVRRCSSRSNGGFDLLRNSHIVWPNVILTIKNWLQSVFIIKPYLDATFNQHEFLDGAKQALTCVSVLMASGDFKAMEGLVTNDVISAAQTGCARLSVDQRHKLAIQFSDIYFCFLHQIGIIMDDNSNQRFVEATVVYHYMPGLEQARRSESMANDTIEQLQEKVHVANYRFIRDYTKGRESDWTINLLNHFKLVSAS